MIVESSNSNGIVDPNLFPLLREGNVNLPLNEVEHKEGCNNGGVCPGL